MVRHIVGTGFQVVVAANQNICIRRIMPGVESRHTPKIFGEHNLREVQGSAGDIVVNNFFALVDVTIEDNDNLKVSFRLSRKRV